VKVLDRRLTAEDGVNGFAEGAGALAVNDAKAVYPFPETGFDVIRYELLDFSGTKRVEVEFAVDGDLDRSISGIRGLWRFLGHDRGGPRLRAMG